MNTEIKINPDLIASYLDEPDLMDEPALGKPADDNRELFLEVAKNTLNFAFESFDRIAKEKGMPGLGSVPAKDASELSFIVAKKHIPEPWLHRSPEGALILLLGGIAYNNFTAFQELKKRDDKE